MYETLFYFVLALNIIKRTAESCIDDFFEIIKKKQLQTHYVSGFYV